MSELFNDLKPKEKKIPDNIQVNQSMFSDLMPSEDKHQYKATTKGNPGSKLSNEDKLAYIQDTLGEWEVEDEEELVDKISDCMGYCIKSINYH